MLKIVKPGVYTTIQDTGRFKFKKYGVPVSGSMDAHSAMVANSLLGNTVDAAVLECTLIAPELLFTQPTFIAVYGANISMYIDKQLVLEKRVLKIASGDVLSFGIPTLGSRVYIAVKGGFTTPKVLGSRSFFMPVTQKNRLYKGDEIPYTPVEELNVPIHDNIPKLETLTSTSIVVHKGPEFGMLSDRQLEQIFASVFTISKENNRMGYQLNETITPITTQIITSATLPGTVQTTSSGKIIILLKDGQTTGGYPRILQLTEAAINCIAQKTTNSAVTFKLLV